MYAHDIIKACCRCDKQKRNYPYHKISRNIYGPVCNSVNCLIAKAIIGKDGYTIPWDASGASLRETASFHKEGIQQ